MAQKNCHEDRSFSDLLASVWCPICGGKLTVNRKDGKHSLHCRVHGEMKSYIDRADLAAAATASFCSGQAATQEVVLK